MIERQQRIEFGEIPGKRAARHRIVDHREPLDAPRDPIAADRFDGHPRLLRQPPLGTLVGVHSHYHSLFLHPSIPISLSLDRVVHLIFLSPLPSPLLLPIFHPPVPRSSSFMSFFFLSFFFFFFFF